MFVFFFNAPAPNKIYQYLYTLSLLVSLPSYRNAAPRELRSTKSIPSNKPSRTTAMTIARPPLATIAAIAAAPILLLSGLAWAGGWIGPPRIGGGPIADALESNAGKHEGYRRAHAKGVCFTGYFDASGGAGTQPRHERKSVG